MLAARLDARAALAPAPIRAGLIARPALHEAAGCLASRGAWVHPLDLALRAQILTGRFATAAHSGRIGRALPSSHPSRAPAWRHPTDLAALAAGEQAVSAALALAWVLGSLPRQHDPLANPVSAADWLGPLGGRALDPDCCDAWQAPRDNLEKSVWNQRFSQTVVYATRQTEPQILGFSLSEPFFRIELKGKRQLKLPLRGVIIAPYPLAYDFVQIVW